MYDNVRTTAHLCPDSLFDICLRQVNENINDIQPMALLRLPTYIKRNILKYATNYVFHRWGRGFTNYETLKALLNKEILNLNLTSCSTTNNSLIDISELCTDLRELILDGIGSTITEVGFQNFIPKMQFLTFLHLEALDSVTDKSISGLTNLKHLKYLILKKCTKLTDDCILTLKNLKLESLDMSFTLIGNKWINASEHSILYKNLTELNLNYCKNISSRQLGKLNWSKLKHTSLIGVDKDEVTARLNSQSGNLADSSSDGTGTRSFYFEDNNKALTNDESGSMEFAMFHLDISSSRPTSPDDIGCLTYNITKQNTEFKKRMDQIKEESFNNWLEGKLNLKKKKQKEKLLAERELKEEKEKEAERLQLIRETKLIEWLNRKKHEKELIRVDQSKPVEKSVKTTFSVQTKADQTKLNFDAWKMKKLEIERLERRKEEKQIRLEEKEKEAQRSLSLEKHNLWLRTAHERPRPVPLNQGLLSLRASLYPIHSNPPWVSNI